MKSHPKPRPLFSCGIFGHCTQSALSPTTPQTPVLPVPPPPPPPPPQPLPSDPPLPPSDPPPPSTSSSSSSSSSTSQSFTQWRFPLPNPKASLHNPPPESDPRSESAPQHVPSSSSMAELFHVAELKLSSGSDTAAVSALELLEKMLVSNPLPDGGEGEAAVCPLAVMEGVVAAVRDASTARTATKVLLALCLAEENRRVAVETGAVGELVEAVAGMEGTAVERALAALELLCTVAEGTAVLRTHALAVPVLVDMVGKLSGRGKECAVGALAAIFTGEEAGPPPPVVAQVVVLALQGECSARGRRKGAQLLKALQENGRLDINEEGS